MTAPTLSASFLAGSSFGNSTSPKATAAINRAVGDVLVAIALAEDSSHPGLTISNETGITWTLQQQVTTGSRCGAWVWTAVASSAANTTVTFTEAAATAFQWGARVFHFTGSDGIGVTNKGDAADTAPSVTLTGVAADSAIVMGLADWEAGPATITYRTADAGTFTQTDGTDHGNSYTTWCGRYANAGAAGNKAVGATSPTAPDWSLVACEVLGTASGAINLIINDLTQAQTLDNIAFIQTHELVINPLTQAQTLDNVVITQLHILVIDNLTQAQTLNNLTITAGSINLVIADLTQAQTLDNLTLIQIHELVVNALTQAQTLDNLTLTQIHELIVNALTQAQTLDNVTLTQVHQLVIAALTQAQTLDNLVVNSATNLDIASLTQAQNIDGLTLTQIHQLVIDSLTQTQNIDSLTLTQVHQLVIAALTQTQILDNAILTQLHQLVIADLTQEQTLTNLVVVPGGPAPTLRPTIDVVAVALIRVLSAIPASRVDTTLPKDTAIWSDGFVQAVGVSEQSGMYVPLHASVISVSCWATNIGSGKPPWGKANQLSEIIKVACLDHSNFPVTLDLSTLGDYGPARVHSAYFITEPHRIPSDEGSYARYDGDLQIYWTPL